MAQAAARQSARQEASEKRRREILDAALTCFAARGYGATTMADIRVRAGASTGSIYHHFKSKEHLAARLYLEGVRSSQQSGLSSLMEQTRTDEGIRALVRAYLGWVEDHPELAAFLFAMRHADFMEPVEEELDRMNRETIDAATEWFRARLSRGELPDIAPDVLRAILYGPSAHFARRYLAGTADVDMGTAKQQLADAAWHALHAMR